MSLMIHTRTCTVCGTVMHNVGATRLYCDPCARKKDLARKKDRRARLSAQAVKDRVEQVKTETAFTPRKKQKLNEDQKMSAVLARAAAAHRTYGQQVEYERRQKELENRGEI